jgi:hypothetical protein
MLSPLPRRSDWACCFAHSPSRVSLPRYGCRVGLRIDLFEACSAFTRVTACTLALSPYFVTRLSEGFSHFVTSMTAPVASGWSVRRVGLAPTGKAPPYHGARQKRPAELFTSLSLLSVLIEIIKAASLLRDQRIVSKSPCRPRPSSKRLAPATPSSISASRPLYHSWINASRTLRP